MDSSLKKYTIKAYLAIALESLDLEALIKSMKEAELKTLLATILDFELAGIHELLHLEQLALEHSVIKYNFMSYEKSLPNFDNDETPCLKTFFTFELLSK